jgi:hypothetical protein
LALMVFSESAATTHVAEREREKNNNAMIFFTRSSLFHFSSQYQLAAKITPRRDDEAIL